MNDKLTEQYYDYIDEYYSHQSEAERTTLPRLPKHTGETFMGNESPINHQTKKQIFQMNTSKLLKAFGYWIVFYALINSFLLLVALFWQWLADSDAYNLSEYTMLIGWMELLMACIAACAAYEELIMEEELK